MAARSDVPFSVQVAFRDLLQYVKKLEDQNPDLVRLMYSSTELWIELTAAHPGINFYIKLLKPQMAKDGLRLVPVLSYERYPQTSDLLQNYSSTVNFGDAKVIVGDWFSTVQKFCSFSLEPENDIEKHYADEYYIKFESKDSDADSAPFDDEKQAVLIKWLDFVAEKIQEYPDKTEELIEISNESKNLSNRLQRLSKNQVLKWYSKIVAKVRMQAPETLSAVFKTGRDELAKLFWKEAFTYAGEALQHFIQGF